VLRCTADVADGSTCRAENRPVGWVEPRTRLTCPCFTGLKWLQAAVALHCAHYNLVRLHKTLRVTPAIAANVTGRVWSLEHDPEKWIPVFG
jgi:hypothetical protein